VEALRKNLKDNKVEINRFKIHEGDNRWEINSICHSTDCM
jgi:hypothetical protein